LPVKHWSQQIQQGSAILDVIAVVTITVNTGTGAVLLLSIVPERP
jgi:hypothetical protein